MHRKTIADVVESLLGAFIVQSGFKAAFAFLHWMGIKVNFKDSALYRVLDASSANLSLKNYINISELEELIGYTFKHKGLLLQAFVHPSFNKHSGGCYQVRPSSFLFISWLMNNSDSEESTHLNIFVTFLIRGWSSLEMLFWNI